MGAAILIALALLGIALAPQTFGARPGLAKRQIPKGTTFVIWIDDARSAAVYRDGGELFASVANGGTEIFGPLPGDVPIDQSLGAALKWDEFANSPVRYESADGKRAWSVLPASGRWQWVANNGPVVQSGEADSRDAAIVQAWSSIGGVA